MVSEPGAERNSCRPPGRAIAERAGRQHGIVDSSELRALGLDRFAVARRVKAGWLVPLYRGVYSAGHAALSVKGRYLAAVRACGPGAALSHRSAAALWGLRPASGPIEVTARRGHRPVRGLRVYRSRLLCAEDVEVREEIPVTSVARTLLDLAAVVAPDHLARALDRAERLRLFDLRKIDEALAGARGRRGAAALRRAVASWRPRHTRSQLEDRFADLIEASALPGAHLNALVAGERGTHEVDAFWPEHRLAVQLDGFEFHRTRRDHERDAESDLDLELAGLTVLRLTWDDVTARTDRTLRRLALRVAAHDR